MGFRSLQHSKIRRSTCRGRCRRPLRSAFRVWLPSGRFAPSEPVPALFHAGGALGIHPSELSPSERYPRRSRRDAPTCRSTRRCSRRRSGGPAQQAAASGFLPSRKSLATEHGFKVPTAGCSLGVRPSRVFRRRLGSGSHPGSSRALCVSGLATASRRRLGVSISLRLAPPGAPGKPSGGQDSPFRVLAPERSRAFERAFTRAIGSPCAAPCIAVGRPACFGRSSSLYRSCSGNA